MSFRKAEVRCQLFVYQTLTFRINWLLLLELSLAGMCRTSPATLTALR